MRIVAAQCSREDFPLVRPYAIASRSVSAVSNFIVQLDLEDGGIVALGAASPEAQVTGETPQACAEALSDLDWLVGRDVRDLGSLLRAASTRLSSTPAARAAVDIALHDAFAQCLGRPLVDVLGRVHDSLPTSITIGIKASAEEVLAEAEEYVGRGFRALKVKLGRNLDEDMDRLGRLRAAVGDAVRIRVDANQGYRPEDLGKLCDGCEAHSVELIEQPLPRGLEEEVRRLPEKQRLLIVADESVHDERDAMALVRPLPAVGILNIKLMKCGGVWAAARIAAIAESSGLRLMWGCMDESVVSIAAALHAAYASPATAFLDLDGSLDLARDVASGGFVIDNGVMRLLSLPGLGVTRHPVK